MDELDGGIDLEKIAAQEQKQFTFQTLVVATKNFHPDHKLGEGGFGPVFKVIATNGSNSYHIHTYVYICVIYICWFICICMYISMWKCD